MNIPVFFGIFLATVITGCGVSMSSGNGPLNLSGNQYWNDPLEHAGDIGMERLMNDIEGMVIDVPPKVYLDERKTIPLVCLWTQDKEKASRNSLATSTWLALSHLETGSLQVVKLARSPDIKDNAPVSKGWINEWLVADINEIAHLGPMLGRYSAWLACGPMVSNIVHFEIYPSRKVEQDKEVRGRISEIRRGLEAPDPIHDGLSPMVGIRSYNPSEVDRSGLSLALESKEKGGLEIKVSFKVEGLEKFLVPQAKLAKDKSGRVAYAWLPLVLLGFTKERSFVYENKFMIPVVAKPKGTPESPVLEGSASIFLQKDPDFRSSSVAAIWATTMNHRSLLEFQN